MLAVLSSVLLLLGVIYIDALQPIFKTVDLGMRDWSLVIVFAGIPTFLMGAAACCAARRRRKRFITAAVQLVVVEADRQINLHTYFKVGHLVSHSAFGINRLIDHNFVWRIFADCRMMKK